MSIQTVDNQRPSRWTTQRLMQGQRELLAQLEEDMQMVRLAKENAVERLSGRGRHADDGDPRIGP